MKNQRTEVGMNKLTVLSEIHSLVSYILEVPDTAFDNENKRKEIITKLVNYYQAVAKDGNAAEIEAAYNSCSQAIDSFITDETIRVRAGKTIDDINIDIQPTP